MNQREQKNIQEDLNRYNKMCDIADRLVEVSSGKRVLDSHDGDMVEFLENKDKVELLLNKLENSSQSDKYLNYIISSDKDRDTSLFFAKLRKAEKQHRVILLKRVASVAAALVISFFIFYTITESPKSKHIVESKINTNYDVPTIVLSDGAKIDLTHTTVDKMNISKNISIVNNQAVKYSSNVAVGDEKEVKDEYNTILIPAKQSYEIELADGTQVMLNANSTLKFPVNFSGRERSVELNGEAYFKVAKSSKPFIVRIGNCSVKVYGTEFNINMNKGNTIETILVEGSIGFTTGANEEIMLKPNQLITLNRESNNCEVSYIDVNKYLGWKNGCFLYEQESLRVILNDIASWYGVRFVMENKTIESTELSINLDRKIKLPELLSYLEKMLKVKFINEGNNQYIVL